MKDMQNIVRGDRRHLDVDGCRLAYRITGEGPPALFVQGVGVQGDAWSPQIDALADEFQCLCFDNRGMAASQPASPTLTVAQMAKDALALLDAQGWSSAHVVGHSLGGLVAAKLALLAPQRVSSLSLLCTFANGRAAATSLRMMWIGARTRIGTRRMRRRAFLEIVYAPGFLRGQDRDALSAEVASLFGHDLADAPPVTGAQLAAMRAEDLTSQLPQLLGIPTLVASGAHDPIAPPTLGRQLAAGIADARYVELAEAAHGAPIQCAATINAHLREHFVAAGNRRPPTSSTFSTPSAR